MQKAWHSPNFKNKFDQLCDVQTRITRDALEGLFSEFGLNIFSGSLKKAVKVFYYYFMYEKCIANNNKLDQKRQEKDEDEDEDDEDSKQQSQQNLTNENTYCLTYDEVIQFLEMFEDKVKYELWKQLGYFKREYFQIMDQVTVDFALKDKYQKALFKVAIGDKVQKYNSQIKINIQKRQQTKKSNRKPEQVDFQEENEEGEEEGDGPISQKSSTNKKVTDVKQLQKEQESEHNQSQLVKDQKFMDLKVKFKTNSLEQSEQFAEIWRQAYEMIKEFITEENQTAAGFLDLVKIEVFSYEKSIELHFTSSDCLIIEMGKFLTSVVDKMVGTEVLFRMGLTFEFDFDFNDFLTKSSTTYYDLFSENNCFKVNFMSSEYLSALKQFLKKKQIFDDLFYDSQDPQTLFIIWLVSSYEYDVNLRLKKPIFCPNKENVLLIMNAIETIPNVIEQLAEGNPMFSKVYNLLRDRVQIEAKVGPIQAKIQFKLKNFDKFLKYKFQTGEDSD